MPLTPSDVHNVAFSKPPSGKRGYNEDEVDAFLDLVELELNRLHELTASVNTDVEAARSGVPASAQHNANRITDAAKAEAAELRAEAEREHSKIMGMINQQRVVLEGRLEQLRTFEHGYRTRLRSYIESQLADLGFSISSSSLDELKGSIGDLQIFERRYRAGLRAYLESQLEELGQRSAPETVTARSQPSPPPKAEVRSEQDGDGSQLETPTINPASDCTETSASGIFISYRRDDEKHFAGRLYYTLSDHFGEQQIFMDVDSIELGLDFTEVLEDRLRRCKVMLVVMGKRWLNCSDHDGERRLNNPEDFVRLEIETALAREGVRVIPILVDDAALPKRHDLPEPIQKLVLRNAIRVDHDGFGSHLNRLLDTLEKVITR